MSLRSALFDLAPDVEVQLLDPALGRPVKTWKFSGKDEITIGRSGDRDVEINDAFVSRNHASLLHRQGQWVLVSQGRNGVLVENRPITELPIRENVNFRLGASGPSLRFQTSSQDTTNPVTMCYDTEPMPLFQLDQSKLQEDVGAIAEADFFQTLQKKAKDLRDKRGKP